MVGEPLQSAAYGGAVHDPTTDAAQDRGDGEERLRIDERIHPPRDANQQAPDGHQEPRPESIDEVRLEWDEPRFEQNERGQ